MISEERLRELIDKKQTIYYVFVSELLGRLDLVEHKYNDKQSIYKYLENGDYTIDDIYDNCWFETKEEANEFFKYGNITRTEKFPYVSWEELNKDFQEFKNGTYTIAECKHIFSLNIRVDKPAISQILLITEDENYKWNYSKENWFKALDLAVELFKGEEV